MDDDSDFRHHTGDDNENHQRVLSAIAEELE